MLKMPNPGGVREVAVIGRPIKDPGYWSAQDLQDDPSWIVQFSADDVRFLSQCARDTLRRIDGDLDRLIGMHPDEMPLDSIGALIANVTEQLVNGRGVMLLRGLPLDAIDTREAAVIYWMIGRQLGVPCSNNAEGDMIGQVTDLGKTQKDANSRGYQTSESMAYHCDQTSVVGLLCVRTPASGGLSKIVSSIAVYNELLRRDPDSVATLAEPFYWTKHGETDGLPYYTSPVLNVIDGILCVSLGPTHIRKGHELPGVPPLTAAQRRALDAVSAIAEELHYAMPLERGDIQLLNNGTVLHTRTEYRDFADPARKRLLWRLWLTSEDVRPLTPYVSQWNAGVKCRGTRERIVV